MGNFSSNQLIKNQDLSVPLVEKETKVEDDSRNIADKQQTKEDSETKESTKKKKKKKLDDIILNQKDLLPEQFSSLEEVQKTYLGEREKKKRSFIESSEWESTVFEIEEITCLTVTNDDKFLISASQTGLITIFDLENKKPVHHIQEKWKQKITSFALYGDNQYVIAACESNIKFFNLNIKEEISEIRYYFETDFLSVILSKDNKLAIAAENTGLIRIFDLSTREEIHCMRDIHQGPIYSIALSNANLYLVTGLGDGSVKIFDFNRKEEVHHFSKAHKGAIYAVAISNDDNYIITGSEDHSIKLFSLKTREELHHFEEAHEDEITLIIVSKDNRYIYSASKDLSIKVFDLETRQEISSFRDLHKMKITSIALSNSQRYLFSGSLDGSIMIFDFDSKQKIYLESNPLKDSVTAIAISQDNKYIISSSRDGYLKIFDFHLKKEKPQLLRCGESIWQIRIFPKSKFVMADCRNTIRVFDLVSMEQISETQKNGMRFESPFISSDERFLLFGVALVIKIFDAITLQEVREIGFDVCAIHIDLSNDMNYLAYGGEPFSGVVDFKTNNKIIEIFIPYAFVKISQDNKYLYVISGGQIQVFSIESKQRLYGLEIREKEGGRFINITKDYKHVIYFYFSPAVIKICSLGPKQELDCYENLPEGDISGSFLSSDNQYLISVSKNGLIKVRKMKANKEGYKLIAVPENFRVKYVSILEDTGKLILALESGSVKMFDWNTKEEIDHFDLGTEIYSFDLSSKGSAITFAVLVNSDKHGDYPIKIFDFNKKKEESCFNLTSSVDQIEISKDGKILAVITSDYINVFDLETKKEKWNSEVSSRCNLIGSSILHFSFLAFQSKTMKISLDSKYLFYGSTEGSISIYDLQTGKLHYSFKAGRHGISALNISWNNKYIVSASIDHLEKKSLINMFDRETKQEIYNFQKEVGRPTAISYDNKILTCKNFEAKNLKVYDVHTMKELSKFNLEGSYTAISKDRKTIIHDASVFQLEEFIYVSPKISNNLIFGGYDNFITSSWPEDVEAQKELLLHYRDMYIYPYSWTLLHLLAIFRPSAISQIPEYAQYAIDFLLDSYEKTPLHYLLAQKNLDYIIINKTFKYMIDYLEDKERKMYERQRIISSLSQCFFFIVSRTSISLVQRYLKICYPQTPLQFHQVLPSFGVSEQKYTYSQIPVIDSQVLQKLYQEGDDRIIFRTNLICLDYDSCSNDMFNTAHVLYENEQEIIFMLPIIENLIDHLWETTKITMYLTASAFSVLMITLSFYIATGENSLYFEISIIIFTTLFLISEAFQGIVLGMEYLRSVWNWIDIIQLLLTLVLIFNKLFSHQEILYEAWMVSIIIITGYLRWLSYLRLFTSTRILIEIILVVLSDMLGFITVIASILIGFSLIFLEFDRYQAISQDYSIYFYNTFKLLFGNYDDTDYNLSQIILVSFLLCILNVVLLNLLIAIIGDSYGKVQEGRDLIDAKTRLEMIQEAMILMRTIKRKTTSEKGYLIYRLPEILEERNLEDRQWEERVSRMEKSLSGQVEIISKTTNELKENIREQVEKIQNDTKKEANELKEAMREQVEKIQNDTKKEVEIIKENVNELKEDMGEKVEKIQNEIQGLKELVNVLLTDLNETIKTIKPNSSKE